MKNSTGKTNYPHATSILVLADSGGSNSASHHIFKTDLQSLAKKINVQLEMCHYPSYCSKWNPIEHRLFPHITRSMAGIVLKTYSIVKELVAKTITKTGLTVDVSMTDKNYPLGRVPPKEYNNDKTIIFDEKLPKWNYKVIPRKSGNN